MYLPSRLNLTSEIEEIISLKNERVDGSSSSSKPTTESGPCATGASLLRTLGVPITKRRVPHVSQLNVAFRARVHEGIAMCRMELGGGDDFCQFLHIDGLYVHDICKTAHLADLHEADGWDCALKLWSLMLRFQRLIRRSSAEMYVSWSEFTEIEWMW